MPTIDNFIMGIEFRAYSNQNIYIYIYIYIYQWSKIHLDPHFNKSQPLNVISFLILDFHI